MSTTTVSELDYFILVMLNQLLNIHKVALCKLREHMSQKLQCYQHHSLLFT